MAGNLYCCHCQTRRSFKIVPKEEWDKFATDEFDEGKSRNTGRLKSRVQEVNDVPIKEEAN